MGSTNLDLCKCTAANFIPKSFHQFLCCPFYSLLAVTPLYSRAVAIRFEVARFVVGMHKIQVGGV